MAVLLPHTHFDARLRAPAVNFQALSSRLYSTSRNRRRVGIGRQRRGHDQLDLRSGCSCRNSAPISSAIAVRSTRSQRSSARVTCDRFSRSSINSAIRWLPARMRRRWSRAVSSSLPAQSSAAPC